MEKAPTGSSRNQSDARWGFQGLLVEKKRIWGSKATRKTMNQTGGKGIQGPSNKKEIYFI